MILSVQLATVCALLLRSLFMGYLVLTGDEMFDILGGLCSIWRTGQRVFVIFPDLCS